MRRRYPRLLKVIGLIIFEAVHAHKARLTLEALVFPECVIRLVVVGGGALDLWSDVYWFVGVGEGATGWCWTSLRCFTVFVRALVRRYIALAV